MLCLIILLSAGTLAQHDFTETAPSSSKTIKLVENIRRQLMQDNYDYQPSEDDDMTTITTMTTVRDDASDTDPTPPDVRVVPRAIDSVDFNDRRDYNVSRKDLFYYMNVDGMRRNMDANDLSDAWSDEADYDDVLQENNTTPKAKYKIIKIKDASPSRRKMSYHRFIQEQNRDGVSIIRLDDDAPFPEFHLPHSRRQYMSEDTAELTDNNDTLSLSSN